MDEMTDRRCPSCGDGLVYVIVASGLGPPLLRRYMCLTCMAGDGGGDGAAASEFPAGPDLQVEDCGSWDLIATHSGQTVTVHGRQACAGQPCCIHNPSTHPLSQAPLHWNGSSRMMLRICQHKVMHPDPDDLAHWERIGYQVVDDHQCDGCCATEKR